MKQLGLKAWLKVVSVFNSEIFSKRHSQIEKILKIKHAIFSCISI